MKKIASFALNHDVLQKGMYLSRTDGDILTYDLRMRVPNQGDYLDNAAIHTFEHLFATFARNTPDQNQIVYFGPMGCRTGFYLLTRDALPHTGAIQLTKDAMDFIANYNEEIPGTKKEECGNYKEHDLQGARAIAKDMQTVLADWTEQDLAYPEAPEGTFV
ncbi:MAG: S-ribosylhomocysteine lyase [Peptoniphilaceae bacterium]